MSATTPATDASPTPVEQPERGLVPLLRDVLVIGGWFLVAGVVGALVWWKVVDLPRATRLDGAVVVGPDELVKQVAIEGWFFVIAAVGGVVSGVLLAGWRHRDPVATVVLVTLGAGLASYVMVTLGRLLGPADEEAALRRLSDGASVPMQLALHAPGAAWVWPVAAALGCVACLWIIPNPHDPAA